MTYLPGDSPLPTQETDVDPRFEESASEEELKRKKAPQAVTMLVLS